MYMYFRELLCRPHKQRPVYWFCGQEAAALGKMSKSIIYTNGFGELKNK